MGLLSNLRELGSLYIESKKRSLQGTPQTRIDSGGTLGQYSFDGQQIDRGELRDVRDMRQKGGVVSQLLHAKALMYYGTGVEHQTENEDLIEWIKEEIPNLPSLLIDLGEDAYWFPYSAAEIVETRGGGFSHIECIEPWTLQPLTNEFGEVVAWEQEVRGDMGTNTERFEPDEIATVTVTKSSGRDNIGISQALRAEEEIESYMQNSRAINNAVEIAAYPHHFWKVGNEGANVIDDDELRRFRNMVDDMEGDTQFVAGADVEHELIEASNFEFEKITEHDLRKLALALGVPLELANVGSDGLGSGMPAELRKTMFERQGRADQRKLTSEVTEQLLRPIIEEYSPFSAGEYDGLRLGDPISEHESSSLNEIAPYLTTNEVRSELDREPAEDEDIGESFREPREVEQPEGQPGEEEGGGIGGLFSAPRALQTRGNPIQDPDECGGTVIEGPQGGLRCIPEGEGGEEDGGTATPSVDGPNDIPEGGFSDEELVDVVDDVVPDTSDIRDGEVTPEKVDAMAQALPSDFDESVFWEEPDVEKPLPNKAKPLVANGTVGVMDDIDGIGDDGLPENLVVQTADGETRVPPEDVSHIFDEDADPAESEDGDTEDTDSTEAADPEEIRGSVSERPDVTDEASGFVERADEPQAVGRSSFEDEIAVFGITK